MGPKKRQISDHAATPAADEPTEEEEAPTEEEEEERERPSSAGALRVSGRRQLRTRVR